MPNEQTGVTMDQLLEFMSQMNEQNQKNLLAAVAEMKKPSEREQAKLDKEDQKIVQQHPFRSSNTPFPEGKPSKHPPSQFVTIQLHPG